MTLERVVRELRLLLLLLRRARRLTHGRLTRCGTGGRGGAAIVPASRQRDALANEVDLDDAHLDLVAYFHHFIRILHETIRELAHMDEAVLVHADVDEGAERGDIGHDALELHSGLEVLHRADVVAELRRL